MGILKKCKLKTLNYPKTSKNYDLPVMHTVEKVSFGKLILEKLRTFVAPKSYSIPVKRCLCIPKVVELSFLLVHHLSRT